MPVEAKKLGGKKPDPELIQNMTEREDETNEMKRAQAKIPIFSLISFYYIRCLLQTLSSSNVVFFKRWLLQKKAC
jgi:hypothetical protein